MASNNKIAKTEINENDNALMQVIENIDEVQNELDMLNEKASEEILTVEQKYNVLRKPFFDKRQELFSNIPDFWAKTFINHPQLSSMLTEKDEEVIQYLQSINVQECEDIKSGFKITFTFKKNPVFQNTVLSKSFNVSSEAGQVVTGTNIEWIKEAKKDVKNGGPKRALEEEESFFEWFADESEASNDEIAEIIKEDLWSNPMNFFLGGDAEEEFEEDEEEGDEDEGEEEEDEEDDE